MADSRLLDHEKTLPMKVKNMSFMVDRLGQDCAPLQHLRELNQNALQGILHLPSPTGEIIWDVDWNRHTLTGVYKLAVIDTGIGMSGEEMVEYINALSSSMSEQSDTGNFGVGAKIAAAPRNHAGLVYLSWKDGIGYMIHLWRDPETGEYGLRQFARPDGSYGHWACIQDDIKPAAIKEHGTMVVLLGNETDQDTMQAPESAASPSRWIARYLNTRYFQFPDGISVKAREGWEYPRSNKDTNLLRTATGQRPYLEKHSTSSGLVVLKGAIARWWVLKDEDALTQNSGFLASSGHTAALYQDELYEMMTGRAGVARLQSFGVIFGHNRAVIYVQPTAGPGTRLTSNTSRTHLLINNEPLPWAEWAAEFRESLPQPLKDLMEEVAGCSAASDHKQSIRERLKQIRDLFRITRYRPTRTGKLRIDEDLLTVGGKGKDELDSQERSRGAAGRSGGKGGRAGDIYSLFLAAKGVPGEDLRVEIQPEVRWVSTADGTRTPPDLEDRAAKFLPQQNLILSNADFRVFTDMVERWCRQYSHVGGARETVQDVVREWFEQQLIETVMGVQALRDARQWSVEDVDKTWSEEALTAAVMPRYHIDIAVKRALGAKLGTLKEKSDRAVSNVG
jgi:hypothetical protein